MSTLGIGVMYVGEPGPSEHCTIQPLLSVEIALNGTSVQLYLQLKLLC